ncbi:MAG: hypothetical protein M3345_05740, partial [Actinomycetota bacterium]|nr:hypothetical protein [Actinomycetota bacterium]
MADPEQIYTEVLAAEQKKGSVAPVAEGRAKAARARAEHGSPHPTEPKWWPGAQPAFEGGNGAAPAEAPAEQPAEEPAEAPAEQPAAAAETDEAAPDNAPAEAAAEQPAAAAVPPAPDPA